MGCSLNEAEAQNLLAFCQQNSSSLVGKGKIAPLALKRYDLADLSSVAPSACHIRLVRSAIKTLSHAPQFSGFVKQWVKYKPVGDGFLEKKLFCLKSPLETFNLLLVIDRYELDP